MVSSCSKWILYYHIVYFALLCSWVGLYYLDKTSSFSLVFSLILLFFFLFLHFRVEVISDRSLVRFWLRPSYIFFISLIIVNLQTIINVILGYECLEYYLGTTQYSECLGKSYYMALIAISSFLYGNTIRIPTQGAHSYDKYWGLDFWIILTIVSLAFFVINIDVMSFVTGLAYKGSGGYDRTVDLSSRWETIFDTFLTISIAVITYNHSNNKEKWSVIRYLKIIPLPLFVCSIIYIFLRLLSGDRGMALYAILLYIYSYIYLSKIRLKLRYLLVILFVGSFFLTLLNNIRGYGSNQSLIEKVERGFEDIIVSTNEEDSKTISVFTQELANSVNCNFISIYDIETNRTDYKYGVYNLCELIGGIPGMATACKKILGINLYDYSTTEYITISFFGKYYLIGLGTTATAAIYLDFGIIGVMIGFLIIGCFFRYVDEKVVSNRLSSIVMLIVLLKMSSMAIYIPRSSFSWFLSRVVYIIIVFLLLNFVLTVTRGILFSNTRSN